MKTITDRNKHSWKGRAALAAALLLGAWTAQACTPHTVDMQTIRASLYWVYTGIRQPLTGWGELMGTDAIGNLHLYRGCVGSPSYSVEHRPDLPYMGYDVDGSAVFEVAENVGVQFRVAVGSNGFGVSNPVGRDGVTLDVSGSENIRMRIWYRYIAITDVSAGVVLRPGEYTWSFSNADDSSLSFSKYALADSIEQYIPPPPPSCWFARSPPSTLVMPATTISMLERDGSGPAQAFDWTIACNSGVPSGPRVVYTAGTTSTDPRSGRMSVAPGIGVAEGVDLEVRRSMTSGGRKTAVEFGRVYFPFRDGTEYLDVRYVPNGEPFKTGLANGSLKVELTFY
ncbi:hypothetical protein ACNJRW_03985 [Stenotrophomonas maltophilia]